MFDTGSLLLLMVVIISIRQNVQSHVRFFSEFVEEWNVTSYICMYRLSFAAGLAHRDPFVLPLEHKEEADEARRRFAGDSRR
jgi:hypothetical protein